MFNVSKRQAIELRKNLGLSTIEPIDIINICRIKEVNLIFKPFSRDSFSGIAMKLENEPFILINSSKTLGHQNFTIAHEFYHLFIEKDFSGLICDTLKPGRGENEQERNADSFAINLLVPDDGIYNFLEEEFLIEKDKIPIEKIVKLELIFGVSHIAMLIKLKRMNIISEDYLEIKKRGVLQLARSMEIDRSLYLPTEEKRIISDYILLARKSFEENKISIGKFEELLSRVDLTINELYSEDLVSENIQKSSDF